MALDRECVNQDRNWDSAVLAITAGATAMISFDSHKCCEDETPRKQRVAAQYNKRR